MSNSSTAIKDNHTQGLVGEFLREKLHQGTRLSFVSAYFTIYAYEKLKYQLNEVESLRFLFGEPRFVRELDPDKASNRAYGITDSGIALTEVLEQKRIARECADWIKEKVEIRSMKKSNFLHGKLYHIENKGVEDALLGSSNFTVSGLGLGGNPNIELNLEVNDKRDRKDLKKWFDELWALEDEVKDVKGEVLEYLEQLYRPNSPEFVYYKTLYHIFERFLEEQEKGGILDKESHITESAIWKMLFKFQQDAVKGAINKIRNFNGCIIADSVGLGKTFEALAVIKYYEVMNQRVLVLCPKKLKANWMLYRLNDKRNPLLADRFRYDVLSHTDLSYDQGIRDGIDLRTLNWGNYDLVVIDESHNFRNNTKGRVGEDGKMKFSRYERLIEVVLKKGIPTKVLLLSATPVNTSLADLRNQINFITEENHHAFGESLNIVDYKETLTAAQRVFTEWADPKKQKDRSVKVLLERLNSDFFSLLDGLTIARSRKHIQRYYKDEMERIGQFPKRLEPISISSEIDLKGEFYSYEKVNDEINKYQLSLFTPSKYLKKEYKKEYQEKSKSKGVPFTQENRETYLIGMMKVNFMKRLESSVHSFGLTMTNTMSKIDALTKRINAFKQFANENPNFDFDDFEPDSLEDEELASALEIGKKLTYKLIHIDVDAWLKDLKKDRDQLKGLQLAAREISADRDAKLAELKTLIGGKVKKPTTTNDGRKNRKVLVFTAFSDTATYLYDALKDWVHDGLKANIALVSGSSDRTTFGKARFDDILINFSPLSRGRDKIDTMPQEGEIDILIGTDCISEGQNLQDCDYLVNYDIHWNPVRVIQRFGRIDRIGSMNPAIQLVNFWPTKDLNKYINLKNRVESRMALVDLSGTHEDNPLETEQMKELIEQDLKYRDKQLLRLQKEVLDLEEFSESPSLSEFTLDDFRIELANYIEANRALLRDAPLGLYGVVPHKLHNNDLPKVQEIIQPGVIYCLRQRENGSGSDKVNPLQPYFLAYVRANGDVRYTFSQPKQILEIFRLLCAGQTAAYDELDRLFDKETNGGSDMKVYNDHLEKAVESIASQFKKRMAKQAVSGRGAQLVDSGQQASEASEFELITWLILK